MQILKRVIASVLVLTLMSPVLLAQTLPSDWGAVEKLKRGTKIIVTTKKGLEFTGKKRQSTGDTLFMETNLPVSGTRTIDLSRDEIQEVRKRKSRWFFPIVGTAIGVGVGVAIGSVADRGNYEDPGLGKALGGFLGGIMGLGAGDVALKKSIMQVVYVAP